jgi:23S rRNA pseudouridine2605 synthase
VKERLQKTLARAGIASRRAGEELITSGRVTVNGEVVTQLGITVDPEVDRIQFDGNSLPSPAPTRVLMLNKPVGYLSTSRPSREVGESVLKLVPNDRRYFTVGRLDRDTSGLLLLTDDGDLAYQLTHPKHGTRKVYKVETTRRMTDGDLAALRSGVQLEDGVASAESVKRLTGNSIELVLTEGRKRQIRRAIAALGGRVRCLHRIRIDNLRLGDLHPGRWRELTGSEVAALRKTKHSK